MAFAIARFVATGDRNLDPVAARGFQRVLMYGTAAAADVAYDIGTNGGTFWTAVGATAPGSNAHAALLAITAAGGTLVSVGGNFAQGYLRGSATGVGVFTQTVSAELPIITFNAGDGPTRWSIVLTFFYPDTTVVPISVDLSI